MNLGIILTVLRKELLESLRDWKTLAVTYGVPLVLYPLLIVWMSEAFSIKRERESKLTHNVVLVGSEVPGLRAALGKLAQVHVSTPSADGRMEAELLGAAKEVEAADGKGPAQERTRALLEKHNLYALIHASDTWVAGSRNFNVELLFDRTERAGMRVFDSLADQIRDVGANIREARLNAIGLPKEFAKPISLKERDLAGIARTVGKLGGPILISVIFLLLCMNCYYPALGASVGERERGTLLNLLATPARATDLVAGKFLATLIMGVCGVLAYSLPMFLLAFVVKGMSAQEASFLAMLSELPWSSRLMILPLLFSAAAVIAALSLSLGFWARTLAEAQAFLASMMFVALVPAALSMIGDTQVTLTAAAIPLLNVSVISQALVGGGVGFGVFALALATNLGAASLLASFSAQVLASETQGQSALVETRIRNGLRLHRPTADLSIVYFFVALTSIFNIDLALSRASPWVTLPLTQLTILVALPLLISKKLGLELRSTFRLVPARPALFAASALIAISCAATIAWLSTFFPIPKEMLEEISGKLKLAGSAPALLLLMAVLPGVCEEFAFRGFILGGLQRRFRPVWAVAISGVLFGLMHVSLLRFVPTALMGWVLGTVATRTRSLWPGMLIHILYNGSLIAATQLATKENHVPGWLAVAGATGATLGLYWLFRETRAPGALKEAEESQVRAA